ncbi:putative death-receptor fusion protein-domain-containing protein [Coniella lustricola]|uniref:Putative death-receptor fusion protein-domain-containing protein n=1 Tax=Coniella lustricola TaxID=2025994 RepID=A0A2T2ZSM4_9PEZI|nr:putative death-receptor fusion protein-domain-containing protein [Coniella lustricola]
MQSLELPPLDGPGSNANDLMAWLQEKPEEALETYAQALFENILAIASQPRSSTKDACVKLCGFTQLCLKSKHESLQLWAFKETTVTGLFDYYLEWNEKDQHRSMRLVLDLVSTLVLQNPDEAVRQSLKENFLSNLVAVIARKSSRPVVKSCMSSLTQFLTKSVFGLDDILRQYQSLFPDLAAQPSIASWHVFVTGIFKWMEFHYICPVAGKFLVTIFSALYARSSLADSSSSSSGGFNVRVLRDWLEAALTANPAILESVKNYVLAPLFKSDRRLSTALLQEWQNRSSNAESGRYTDNAALLHLAALEVGKKSSIVDDPSPEGAKQVANIVQLDREIIEHFLMHPSHEVRSFAMSLLVTSSSTTKPYSSMAFELLRLHLRSFHADPDAKFRNEILAHTKNMVKRIKGAISVLQKDISRLAMKLSKPDNKATPVNTHISQGAKQIANAGESWLRESLRAHEAFFEWYLEFLRFELVPTASYQRHITALKSLVNIVKLEGETRGLADERIQKDPQWVRTILDLVMDPFDDVRETATGLLMLFPKESVRVGSPYGAISVTLSVILSEFSSRATELASRTSRADHSDGTARSLGLLCAWQDTLDARLILLSKTLDELERKIAVAEQDLGHAVIKEPVHGTFAAVHYVWEFLSRGNYTAEELQLLVAPQNRIVTLCQRIWNVVSYVLCDDSPEGHLPEELEEMEGLDTKGLLSYSFRAAHESSNLMRTLVSNLKSSRVAGHLLPPPEVFRAVGNLAFTQLSTLRHRGAFSSVSLTFTSCCQHAEDPAVAIPENEQPLLESWYQGTLSCIQTQRSTTRRSAGVPALMTGILASNANAPSFQEVMKTLQQIAAVPAHVTETDGSNLPQVHAFNCLKEVFKSSLLSKSAESYLAECLQLATSSLRSEVWAIRNCALLLLRSLIDTLFGTTESKSSMETGWDGKTLRLSYTKYSSLPPILLSLLRSGERAMEPSTLTQSSAAESVFPALEIIRRAGPPESHREELYRYIANYLGSRQWHVREIAARTLCSFLLNEDWAIRVKALLQQALGSVNKMHGSLLAVKFFLERRLADPNANFSDVLQNLEPILRDFEISALASSETAAAYIEIRNDLWQVSKNQDIIEESSQLLTKITSLRELKGYQSAALLNNRLGINVVHCSAVSGDLATLETEVLRALDEDVDTASALLEAMPGKWDINQTPKLCELYLQLAQHTTVPDVRAIALSNLADLMDDAITRGNQHHLPSPQALASLQNSFADSISPTLANAILLVSGPTMAIHTRTHHGQFSFFTFEQRLRAWGAALADALHDTNTFDMRMAAARAAKSFAAALRSAVGSDAAYIPFLLALYVALVDDEEEVRDVGAAACSFVLADNDSNNNTAPQPLVAVDAADALLAWMQRHYGQTNEFRAYVACRLVGDPLVTIDISVQDLSAWTTPEAQFTKALHVDESLFAIEEQNLFIDEVREADRWAHVFAKLPWDYDEGVAADGTPTKVLMIDSTLAATKEWAETALKVLAGQIADDDGPLGWTSNPGAFALCYRVLVCGRTLSELLGADGQVLAALLRQIRDVGPGTRLHGLLLSTLD